MIQVVPREAGQLYSMVALLKCSQQMGRYVLATPYKSVSGEAAREIKGVINRIDLFQESLLKGVTKQDRIQWDKDFDRDYAVYSSVFELMAAMTDEQRERLELFAVELSKEE